MIKLGRKAEKIYTAIINDIDSGNYRINARLPTESEFCKSFNCCHNTVRRALDRLILEGRIESKRGSGSYVKNSTEHDLANFISLMYIGSHSILTKIQDAALQRNCMLAFYSQNRTHWDSNTERKFLQQVKEQKHKGLLAFCSPISPYNERILSEIQSAGTMVVHYEYYKEELPNENFILPDYRQAGYLAATNLMISGCRRLYYCSLDDDTPFEILQEKGFLDALRDHSISDAERKPFSEFKTKGNYFRLPKIGIDKDGDARLDSFISSLEPGSGIACSTIGRANIIMDALRKRNISLSEDVKVIGTEMLGDSTINSTVSYIHFNRNKIFKKALDSIFDPACKGIHEMAPPILCLTAKQ